MDSTLRDSANCTEAAGAVQPERAAAFALRLVEIPGPTGDTAAVSRRLSEELRSLGMEVSSFDRYPRTPVVIGRLRGAGDGPALILNGHLDTVPVPHAPARRAGGILHGRGAADMRGAIAGAVEAIRALRDSGARLRGDLILCAHGLHEAPGGVSEDLEAAIAAGAVSGDGALVLELAHDYLPVAQMGMGIYRALLRRSGPVLHEQKTPSGTPHPAAATAEAIQIIHRHARDLAKNRVEHLGEESIFIGQIHCGDFYNRFPNQALIEGTRRYRPGLTAPSVEAELRMLLEPAAARGGMELELSFSRVRDGCLMDPEHPLATALQQACAEVMGAPLPLGGSRVVADAPLFAGAGIPCYYHGIAGQGAHADEEWAPEDEIARVARVYACAAIRYCGADGAE